MKKVRLNALKLFVFPLNTRRDVKYKNITTMKSKIFESIAYWVES